MSKIFTFLFIITMTASINLEAALFKRSATENRLSNHDKNSQKYLAQQLYQEAFKACFTGEWARAARASRSAALMDHGTNYWKVEGHDLIK